MRSRQHYYAGEVGMRRRVAELRRAGKYIVRQKSSNKPVMGYVVALVNAVGKTAR